jgi:hypothetical protein
MMAWELRRGIDETRKKGLTKGPKQNYYYEMKVVVERQDVELNRERELERAELKCSWRFNHIGRPREIEIGAASSQHFLGINPSQPSFLIPTTSSMYAFRTATSSLLKATKGPVVSAAAKRGESNLFCRSNLRPLD